MAKIQINAVSKIFGDSPDRALQLLGENLGKEEIFKRTRQVVGVDNISLDVEEGEIVVLMGLSGSGKSTLLRCVNRLIDPDAGSIHIDGQEVTALPQSALREIRRKKIGMVFQHFALFPHRTVLQNVGYGLELAGMDPAEIRKRAMPVVEMVGLKGWENSRPHQLSGGMQQRVGLARALALDPDILLMDEAFSALDPLTRRDMQGELLRIQDEMRKTIIFVSHDLDESISIGNRIALMRDGAIVQIGSPEDILNSPADAYVSRFVSNVDVSKVLTAGSIMKRSETVGYIDTDGPRTAMRKMRAHGIANLFVLDNRHRLLGLINATDTAALMEKKAKKLDSILLQDIKTVSPDTSASELISIMKDIPYPLAVVDAKSRLLGVIVRGLVLGAIAERKGTTDNA